MDAFFANLYELFALADLGNFSNDMYLNGFYNPIGSMLVKLYTDAEMEMPYGIAQFLPFCIVAGALTLFFFFIFSFIVKWGSRNCKHSPFL